MRQRLRSRLTYANVISTLALFLVLGGGTALAAYVVSSNSQIGPGTVSGHKPPSGKHANIIAGSVNGQDVANGSLGQVREFSQSTNTASALTPLLTFRSITLSRKAVVVEGTLVCRLFVSSTAAGRFDGYLVNDQHQPGIQPTLGTIGQVTPISDQPFGVAADGSQAMGQIVFVNNQAHRAVTVHFSIYGKPANAGCSWQGTLIATK